MRLPRWFRFLALPVVFGVGLLVGRVVPGESSIGDPAAFADDPGVERLARPSARLTAPWYEPAGVRALAGPLVVLERELADRVAELRSSDPTLQVGIYLRDLDGGSWIGVNEDDGFVPASLMKVAVLFHALSRIEHDPDLLARRIVYPGPEAMPSEDNLRTATAPLRMVPGGSYAFRDLLRRMIAYSDNHAKDLVLQGVDPEEVESWMTSIGFPTLVADGRAVTTPSAYGGLFRVLYSSSLFSRETSELGLELLLDATWPNGMRAALPASVPIASKFGIHFDARDLGAGAQLHECGIVYVERPTVLCVMTRSQLQSFDQLAAIVREVTARSIAVPNEEGAARIAPDGPPSTTPRYADH